MKAPVTLESRAWRDARVSLPFARFTREDLAALLTGCSACVGGVPRAYQPLSDPPT